MTAPFFHGINEMKRISLLVLGLPVNFQVQSFYNAIHPKTLPHPQRQFRISDSIALLFPAEKQG